MAEEINHITSLRGRSKNKIVPTPGTLPAKYVRINMDPEEMTDVKWFSREEVLQALDGDTNILRIPMKLAIAHHLVKSWALGEI